MNSVQDYAEDVTARLGTQPNHPNIISVVEFDELEGEPLRLAEHLDGVSCRQMLCLAAEQEAFVPIPVALEIACETLEALAYMHDLAPAASSLLGRFHLNVCPENIFIGAMGEVKLADFGIAARAAGLPKGKSGYRSPEQVDGRQLDGRSDLFSLAVVVFELLTGAPLFGGTEPSRFGRTREAALSPLSDGRFGSLPFELRLILATALAPVRIERFEDAREFSVALLAFARHAGMSVDRRALVQWLRQLDVVPTASGTYPAVRPSSPPTVG